MRHGDLSNEVPRRILVFLNYVALPPDDGLTTRLRRRRHNHRAVAAQYVLLPATIAQLLRMSARHGLHVELFAVGITQEELDAVVERLDTGQAHPFTHATCYPTLNDFVSTLPYRPEVIGVVDVPERALRYGSWFMSTYGL